MVAYSFKARFADPILAGTKAQTIRAPRKRHARPGDELQLYTGMRTKHCRLIARVTCESVTPVRLRFHRDYGPLGITFDGVLLSSDAMERFAEADGFGSEAAPIAILDMATFWFAAHGRGVDEIDFNGFVITWRPLAATFARDGSRAHQEEQSECG